MIQHINHIRAEVIGANQYEVQVELQLHTNTLLETMNIDLQRRIRTSNLKRP